MFNIEGFVTTENFVGAVDGTPIRKHHYATNDTASTIKASGYFNRLRDEGLIRKGDLIVVSGGRDSTPFAASYVFASVPGVGGGDVTMSEHGAVTQNIVHSVRLPDISTKASSAAVVRYVASFSGSLGKIYSVLNGALAGGDAILSVDINGTVVTGGAITALLTGSAAGAVYTTTATAANPFQAGDVITVSVGGASTATVTAGITLDLMSA